MDITTQAIPLGELHESPWNPRKHFAQKTLEDLAESIRKVGILSPVLVRPRVAGGYEIAAGHRRSRAAKLAQLLEVPAIVRPMPDQEFLEVLTIENLQREDVHPLEEGEGYRTLMQQTGWDVDVVAAKVGKSKSYVYQRLKLADLIEPAKKAFLAEKITAGHAILIARLQPKDQAEALTELGLEQADEDWYDPTSVRQLASWIEHRVHMGMVGVPWRKDDAGLVPEAGPCSTCLKRSGNVTDLFPDLAKKDVCTDRACFQKKHAAHIEREIAKAEAKGRPLVKLGDWNSRGDGYVRRGEWEEAKADSCPYVKKGIVMTGHDGGRVLTFCANRDCKTHHGDHRSPWDEDWRKKQAVEEAKRRRETERRKRVLMALRAATPKTLDRGDLEYLALAFYEDIWSERQKQLVRLEGWDQVPGVRKTKANTSKLDQSDCLKIVRAKIPELTILELNRFLLTLTHFRALDSGEVNPFRLPGLKSYQELLQDAAESHGVDVKAIDQALKIEENAMAGRKAAKAKPSVAGEKAVQALKTKGNGKDALGEVVKRWKADRKREGKTPSTFDEPTCTNCGCTEMAACEGGCSWVQLDKTTNAGLCSACAEA